MQAVKIAILTLCVSSTWRAVAAEEAPVAAEAPTATTAVTNAGDAAVVTTPTPTPSLTNDATIMMDVRVKVEGGVGQLSTSRAYITVGTNRFAFLVPAGFKIDTSDAQKVTLVRPDSACVLSLRILEALPDPGLTPALCREKIQQDHPACTIDEEFTLAAGNGSGPAFEIRWKGDGGVRRMSRIAYIPVRSGIVEFSIDSSPEKFGAMLGQLNYVMLTFRASDPSGKIEATPLYNNI